MADRAGKEVWICAKSSTLFSTELMTLFSDRFIGDMNATIEHHFLDVSEAERKSILQNPKRVEHRRMSS
jgi:hypothetical protein